MGDTKRLRGGRRTNWRDRAADTSSFGKPQPQLVSAYRRPIGSPPFASPDQNGRVEFAPDSPLERIGFEPQSPQQTRCRDRRFLLFGVPGPAGKTATCSQGGDQRFESHLLSQPLAFGYAFRLGSPAAG